MPDSSNQETDPNTIVVTGQRFVTFNIENFRSEINNYGALATHSFLVRFAPFTGDTRLNSELSRYTTINKDKLIMRCDNAVMPAVSLIKEEAIRRYGYGPTEVVPYGVTFGDFTLQWIVDSNSEIVDFFNRWVNLIVNHDSKGGADMISSGEFNNYDPYEVGFKDDYSNSKCSVFVYDRQLNTTIEYSIYDVFPISIQSVNLAWGEENQMMKYNVTFAFTDMIMKTPKSGDNALFLAEQQAEAEREALARRTQSTNAEKANPNDIVVNLGSLRTTMNRSSGTTQFNGPLAIGGDYTVPTIGSLLETGTEFTAASLLPPEYNIVTIPNN